MTLLQTRAPTSPFKFLDAYGADDGKTFFGRQNEVEALYALVMKSRLVLVYGPSGSGKTSLIQCGLANRFKPTDWFPVFVRRGENLNTSLRQRIEAEAVTPIDGSADVVTAARSLYLDFYRPIYFIFDQFEELFILQDDKKEEGQDSDTSEGAAFFASIQALLASDLNCKIVISMREEYIAWLQDFEAVVPTLFDSRLRVEQMTLGTVQEVIIDMTAAVGITLENGAQTAKKITEQMGDRRVGVQLAYLQVYLDRLYREARKTATPQLFTDALVAELGELGDVMAEFLEEQTQAIANDVRSRHPSLPRGAVHRVLEALTTVEGTKQPVSRDRLAEDLPELAPMLGELLAALDDSRIIRQTGDMIEVSHDQLAKRIAERRSADSKSIALVQRLVRDRLAGYEQTKTWLAAEELVKVQPMLPALGLSKAEADFVEKSRKRLRWQRVRLVGSTAMVVAVLAGFGAYAGFQNGRAIDAVNAASTATGAITSTIATDLVAIDNTRNVRKSLLEELKRLNAELEAIDSYSTFDTGFWLAILEGELLLEDNDPSGARQKFVAALGTAESQRAALPASPDAVEASIWRRNVAAAASRLAQVELQHGTTTQALVYFRKALAIDEANARANPVDVFAQHDLLLSYGNFGGFERERGELESARRYLEKALAIARTLETRSEDRNWQRDHGFYLWELGKVERDSGNLDKARAALAESARRFDAIADSDPSRLDWRFDSMWAHYDLADVDRRAGQWSEALRASDAAYTALDALSQDRQIEYGQMLKVQRDLIDRQDRRVAAPAGAPG